MGKIFIGKRNITHFRYFKEFNHYNLLIFLNTPSIRGRMYDADSNSVNTDPSCQTVVKKRFDNSLSLYRFIKMLNK